MNHLKLHLPLTGYGRTMVSLSGLITLVFMNFCLLISAHTFDQEPSLTNTVTACEGSALRLSCDTGVILVQSATFGRQSSHICKSGKPQDQISNTKCSIDVPVVSVRCNGLDACELSKEDLARPDPCYGTYKYYTIKHLCIPAETSVTCEGDHSVLKCEYGEIQVIAANFGRTDKTICSEGRPSSQFQNANCYSPNALAPVSKSCDGLQSCGVSAALNIFTDPCPGTYKYLSVSYYCLLPEIRSSIICENANADLKCEEGHVIHIHSANYGRNDDSTCSAGRPASQIAKTDCYALNSQTVVSNGCEGKNSCSISASNSVFSDPCYGTFKYLYIAYSCMQYGS